MTNSEETTEKRVLDTIFYFVPCRLSAQLTPDVLEYDKKTIIRTYPVHAREQNTGVAHPLLSLHPPQADLTVILLRVLIGNVLRHRPKPKHEHTQDKESTSVLLKRQINMFCSRMTI